MWKNKIHFQDNLELDFVRIRALNDFARAPPALRQPDVQLVSDLLVSLSSALSREGHVAHLSAGSTFVRLPFIVNAILE